MHVSSLSLTYYGFCLLNGNYIVKLHFAEIIFDANDSYGSLGRRVFDIYVQGKLELKDFVIVKAAGGVGKVHIEILPAVVTSNTLEIRWRQRNLSISVHGGASASTIDGGARNKFLPQKHPQHHHQHQQQHINTVSQLLAGGIAGAVGKTCTAPLARILILFQMLRI
ncbi:hypothetical protein MKX03_016110 [Papaver bracteatum]|nr:hypothetical protein MKX03_016110 [Papaver bracteatum]